MWIFKFLPCALLGCKAPPGPPDLALVIDQFLLQAQAQLPPPPPVTVTVTVGGEYCPSSADLLPNLRFVFVCQQSRAFTVTTSANIAPQLSLRPSTTSTSRLPIPPLPLRPSPPIHPTMASLWITSRTPLCHSMTRSSRLRTGRRTLASTSTFKSPRFALLLRPSSSVGCIWRS